MEEELHEAISEGNTERAKELLDENPDINVNWVDEEDHQTALQLACQNDRSEIVALLLKHSDINVNSQDYDGYTAFMGACVDGSTSCARLLFKDARVNLKLRTLNNETPLMWAALGGHLELIKWWIASGREMDLGKPGNQKSDAIGAARDEEHQEVVALLEGFRDHPDETRLAVRSELNWYDEEAADRFAVIIFLCDGLLAMMKMTKKEDEKTVRFLEMVGKLPMEMQMKVSHIAVESARENIPRKAREGAFKKLAKKLKSNE